MIKKNKILEMKKIEIKKNKKTWDEKKLRLKKQKIMIKKSTKNLRWKNKAKKSRLPPPPNSYFISHFQNKFSD